MLSDEDIEFLRRACALAFSCPPSREAFSVGAILVNSDGDILAEGYSRMDGDNTHAEQAILQRLAGEDLRGCVLYSSLQPCGNRLSGVRSCQDYICDAGLAKVIYAVREPDYFVQHGGDGVLLSAGVEVICANLFLHEVQEANQFVKNWHAGS